MSWEQLVNQRREAAEERRAEVSQPPTACPNDGQPLVAKGGVRHCPFDGWEWPRDAGVHLE